MWKSATAAMAAALTLAAHPAAADTFSPANSTAVFEGTLTILYTHPIPCAVTMEIQTNSAGTGAAIVAGDFNGSLACTLFDMTLPFQLDAIGGGMIIQSFQASWLTSCGPIHLAVEWDASAQAITFDNQSIGRCGLIDGTLVKTSGPTLTIAP